MPKNNAATGQHVPPSPVAAGGARRHRLSAAARTLGGTLGAYVLTVEVTVILSFLLAQAGMARVEAVTAATLASFAVFAVIAMAVFHAQSTARAWLWLVGTAVPLALLGWVLGPA